MKCSNLDYYKFSNSYAIHNFVRIHSQQGIKYDLENFIQTYKNEINESAKIFSELQSKLRKGKPIKLTDEGRKRKSEAGKRPKNLNKTGLILNGQYIFVPNEKVDEYIKLGATIGRGPHTKESKEKNRQSHLGKKLPHNKEWNENIGKNQKGKKLSEETKQKISNNLKGNLEKCGQNTRGKIVINNGKICKYVFEKEFEEIYKLNGWVRGELPREKTRVRGKIRINNENGAKYVTLEEFETKYKYEGWHRGYDWKKK